MRDVLTEFDGVEKLHRSTFLAREGRGSVYGDHDGGRVVDLQDSACELDTDTILHAHVNANAFSVGTFAHHDETERVPLVLQVSWGHSFEAAVVEHFGARP